MSIKSELRKVWKRLSDPAFRDNQRQLKAFRATHGRGTPERFNGLKPGDIVIDAGGYRGDWAARMSALYGVTVHVFEAHPRFVRHLEGRFAGDSNIHVHGYAVGSHDGVLRLSDDENASSALDVGGAMVEGQVRAAVDVFKALELNEIAVLKMNIEGGEYDLLPALLDSGLMSGIARLTVQFHRYDESQATQRDIIRERLAKTHDCVWCFPFLWEEWARR